MARVLKGSHSFTCTPRVHPLTEWTIPAQDTSVCLIEKWHWGVWEEDSSVSLNKLFGGRYEAIWYKLEFKELLTLLGPLAAGGFTVPHHILRHCTSYTHSTATDSFKHFTTKNGGMFTDELTSHVTNLRCLSSQSRYCVSVADRVIQNCAQLAKILFICT